MCTIHKLPGASPPGPPPGLCPGPIGGLNAAPTPLPECASTSKVPWLRACHSIISTLVNHGHIISTLLNIFASQAFVIRPSHSGAWFNPCLGKMMLNRLDGEWAHPCWYLFYLSSHYVFLFMDCTAISDMTVLPFLTLHDAETSVLWKKNLAYRNKHGPWQCMIEWH